MATLTGLVLVLLLLGQIESGAGVSIHIRLYPGTIDVGSNETFSVSCYTTANESVMNGIKIFKSPELTQPLAQVTYANDTSTANNSIPQRATTYTLGTSSRSEFRLNFRSGVSCGDTGLYVCEFNYTNGAVRRINLTLTSRPRDIQIAATPNQALYNINDTLELRCWGLLGKPLVGSWVWEVQDQGATSWSSLSSPSPVDGTPVPSGSCQMRGNSTLSLRLRREDDRRRYRCSWVDANLPFSGFSADFTIRLAGNQPAFPPWTGQAARPCSGAAVAISLLLTFLQLRR